VKNIGIFMIRKLSSVANEGGFEKWKKFHDCMLSDVTVTSKIVVITIDELYDWDTRRLVDGKVMLVLSSAEGIDIFHANHDFCRMIHRIEIDDQRSTIRGIFPDESFTLCVDFEESFVIEV
jgi:hypothetical protein